MQSMKLILITYGVILTLGIASMVTKIHYFANIAGFIAAIGFMLVFFKDPVDEDENSKSAVKTKAYKKYWYIVFATGILFSFIFGSLWNSQMGGMQ